MLVGVVLDDHPPCGAPLEELEGLAKTAGARVVGQLSQRRQAPDATTYIGKGKVEELKFLVGDADADVVLFDNDLSPGQGRNLEKALGVKVLDRTELILDIFAGRAQTYEARLAVELAQLEYSLPRLKRMWTHLSRQKKGIGLRGPGEKQLETDRRLVEHRIHDLRTELKAIHRRRAREVATRARLDDRLPGRLHQRRQEHPAQSPDRGRRPDPGRPLLHAGYAHAAVAAPGLGTGPAERHGGLHPQLAAPPDRQFPGDAGRGAAGPPAPARGRRQQHGGAGADQCRLQGPGRDRPARAKRRSSC